MARHQKAVAWRWRAARLASTTTVIYRPSIYFSGAMMTVASKSLLVKFCAKDTQFGVTRGTLKALAKELDVNETQVIHIALSKLAADVLPAYELDDGPLTPRQMTALRKDVGEHFSRGRLISRESLSLE